MSLFHTHSLARFGYICLAICFGLQWLCSGDAVLQFIYHFIYALRIVYKCHISFLGHFTIASSKLFGLANIAFFLAFRIFGEFNGLTENYIYTHVLYGKNTLVRHFNGYFSRLLLKMIVQTHKVSEILYTTKLQIEHQQWNGFCL